MTKKRVCSLTKDGKGVLKVLGVNGEDKEMNNNQLAEKIKKKYWNLVIENIPHLGKAVASDRYFIFDKLIKEALTEGRRHEREAILEMFEKKPKPISYEEGCKQLEELIAEINKRGEKL